MSKLLVVNTSPRLKESKSRALAADYVAAWRAAHPEGTVRTEDLAMDLPPHVDEDFIAAMFTPVDARNAEQTALLARSDGYIEDLNWANTIVFALPMHNFSIPSALKAYIDHICRAGVTFQYGENGPEGLLGGRQAVILVARGGHYAENTPAAVMNHQDTYLKTVLGFLGITEVRTVSAEGVAAGDEGFEAAKGQIPLLLAA